jgi:hypothetical protein
MLRLGVRRQPRRVGGKERERRRFVFAVFGKVKMDAADQVPSRIASLQEFLNPAFRFRQLESKSRIQFLPESAQDRCGQIFSTGHGRRSQHKLMQLRGGRNWNMSFWWLRTGIW